MPTPCHVLYLTQNQDFGLSCCARTPRYLSYTIIIIINCNSTVTFFTELSQLPIYHRPLQQSLHDFFTYFFACHVSPSQSCQSATLIVHLLPVWHVTSARIHFFLLASVSQYIYSLLYQMFFSYFFEHFQGF